MGSQRRSIEVENFSHGAQPIPAACRLGNILATGGIYGLDTRTAQVPDDLEQQASLMFANLESILVAAGAALDDVVKMTFWIKHPAARSAINPGWLKAFPDPASRPARHTLQNDHMAANLLIQCDALAVITSDR
jgi:enamine deaminase RidA (YjgF/YER057c/UK114 family)